MEEVTISPKEAKKVNLGVQNGPTVRSIITVPNKHTGYDDRWDDTQAMTDYESYVVEDEEGWPCCSACQQYVVEDEDEYYRDNDADTDEEGFQVANDMSQPELQQYLGDMANTTYDGLKSEYLWAKRRFRQFSQKSSRISRFPRKSWSMSMSSGKGRRKGGRGKGKRGYHYEPSVIGHSSLAGGKG